MVLFDYTKRLKHFDNGRPSFWNRAYKHRRVLALRERLAMLLDRQSTANDNDNDSDDNPWQWSIDDYDNDNNNADNDDDARQQLHQVERIKARAKRLLADCYRVEQTLKRRMIHRDDSDSSDCHPCYCAPGSPCYWHSPSYCAHCGHRTSTDWWVD